MKEAILELRTVISRLRPQLLPSSSSDELPSQQLQQKSIATEVKYDKQHEVTAAAAAKNTANNSQDSAAIVCELQLEEATTELVTAIATFVWNLDCLWDNIITSETSVAIEDEEGDGADKNGSPHKMDTSNNGEDRTTRIIQEPQTEWNDDSKAIIREGYGLLAITSSPPSDDILDNSTKKQQQKLQQHEALKSTVRASILELLPTISTSSCRHFLLEFLPHFMPLTMRGNVKIDSRGIGPSWLRDDDDDYEQEEDIEELQPHLTHSQSAASQKLIEDDAVTTQILDTFQSLIQTDVSTLIPFLATLSILFENMPDHCVANDGQDNERRKENKDTTLSHGDASGDTKRPGTDTDKNSSARNKCFHLCLSSLSSISEHDLPSLIHSLFILVRNVDEGRLAMDVLRMEWNSLCGTDNEKQTNSDDSIIVFFVGNVIIQSILAENMPSSVHLAGGFLSIFSNAQQQYLSSQQRKPASNECTSSYLSLLDAILLIALYSQYEYQHSVESIFNSMSSQQTLSFIKLLHPLIHSWLPSKKSNSDRRKEIEWEGSILYEQLSSPLISILFYIVMISASSDASQGGQLRLALMGGILPFLSDYRTNAINGTSTKDSGEYNMITDACCRVFSELFSAVDPQKQEQILNSLQSMLSDSFVRSSPTILSNKQSRKRHRQKSSKITVTVRERQDHQLILLLASQVACRTLLLISNNNVSSVLQIKGIVMDRMLLLASMLASTTSSNDTDVRNNNEQLVYHLFDMNCAILVSLLQDTNGEGEISRAADSSGSSELLILCQKLLFSANFVSTATSNSNNSYHQRVICGIILASRLLRYKLIPTGERGSIWSWIIKIISPSSTATPLDALDPAIARWGLIFLQFASSVVPSTYTSDCNSDSGRNRFPEISRFVETQPVCGESDVFKQVNTMLATAAIIQMEDDLKVPLFKEKSTDNTPQTFLAFAESSNHDQLLRKKKSPTATNTSMVICGPYFLHGLAHTSTPEKRKLSSISIDLVAEYVYDLVDRYLELGRIKSGSWNPRGWLLAKIQLPSCLSESTMNILGMKPSSLELDADCESEFHKRWKLLFTHETNPKAIIIYNLVEFANCVIISISVSHAVLKHSYHHFQKEEVLLSSSEGVSGESEPMSQEARKLQRRKKKQLEALRKLLQFQIHKIHMMQQICKNIHLALNGLYLEVCKMNSIAHSEQRMVAGNHRKKKVEVVTGSSMETDNTGNTTAQLHQRNDSTLDSSYERKRIPLSEIKYSVTAMERFLSSEMNTIGNAILWSCMNDDVDDTILLDNLGKSDHHQEEGGLSSVSAVRVSRIIRHRGHILNYLEQNIIHLNNKTYSFGKKSQQSGVLSLPGVARVLRLTVSLSAYLDHTNESGDMAVKMFLAAHYQLLLAVFSFATKETQLKPSLKNNVLQEKSEQQPSSPAPSHIEHSLAAIIQECADSLPKAHFEVESTSLDEGLGLSSAALSTPAGTLSNALLQQLSDCNDASISCHIVDLLCIISIHTESSCDILAKITSDALRSIHTTISAGEGNLPYTFFKLNSIISEIAVRDDENDRMASFVKESFSILIQASNALLKTKDSFASAFVHNLLAHWSALVLEGSSQFYCLSEIVGALEDFLSRAFQRSKHNARSPPPRKQHSIMPSINERTHTTLFELLLHMINASFALAKPRLCASTENQNDGPYGEVIGPMNIYGQLITMFQSNYAIFPRRFVLTVIKSSLFIIRLSDYQLQRCIEWRTSQPTQMGTVDMHHVAADLLQPLIDSLAFNCIGCINSFCNTMKVDQGGNRRGLDRSYKHTKAIAGLLYRCEGLKEIVLGVCQSQNLTYPRKDFTPLQGQSSEKRKSSMKRKRQRGNRELSPRRKIPSRGHSEKVLASPSVLEMLPAETDLGQNNSWKGDAYATTEESVYEESHHNGMDDRSEDNHSVGDSDSGSSFEVVGDWA